MSWPLREGTDAHCGGTGHALRRAVPGSMKEEPDVTTSRSTAQLAAQARRDQAAAAGAANPAADSGGCGGAGGPRAGRGGGDRLHGRAALYLPGRPLTRLGPNMTPPAPTRPG